MDEYFTAVSFYHYPRSMHQLIFVDRGCFLVIYYFKMISQRSNHFINHHTINTTRQICMYIYHKKLCQTRSLELSSRQTSGWINYQMSLYVFCGAFKTLFDFYVLLVPDFIILYAIISSSFPLEQSWFLCYALKKTTVNVIISLLKTASSTG